MISFFLYCLKVCLCSGCFAVCYLLFLRQGRFHRWNRYYILAAMLLSCCIPLLSIPVTFSTTATEGQSSFNTLLQYNLEALTVYAHSTTRSIDTALTLNNLLFGFYLVVVCALTLMLVRSLRRIRQLQRGSQRVQAGAVNIYMVRDKQAPYSFFSSIFWNENIPLTSADGQCVLRHELVHLRQRHSIDKLFLQLCCIIFWINPFFWLLRHELNLVHEFIADEASVADNDSSQLSALILCSVYPQHYLQFISPFFQTPIKRRLIMLANQTSIKFKMQRKSVAILLPLLCLAFAVCNIHIEAVAQDNTSKVTAQPQQAATAEQKAQPKAVEQPQQPAKAEQKAQPKAVKTETVPLVEVEVKPKFQGGSEKEFAKWVAQQITYPEAAKEQEIQGRVTCSFVVDEEGNVTDVKIQRSVNPLLDSVAVKVISSSPKWTPGKQKGKAVRVNYTFPVIFQIRDSQKTQYEAKKEEKQ